jgi:hypothetical protein
MLVSGEEKGAPVTYYPSSHLSMLVGNMQECMMVFMSAMIQGNLMPGYDVLDFCYTSNFTIHEDRAVCSLIDFFMTWKLDKKLWIIKSC